MKILSLLFLFIISYLFLVPHAFASDTVPPMSTLTLDPATPNGANGWYLNNVNALISAVDVESGVKTIYYKINNNDWVFKNFSNTLNLVYNQSFENDLVGTWAFVGEAVGEKSTEYFYDGLYSAKILSSTPLYSKWSNTERFVVVNPLETLTVSVAVKTIAVSSPGVYFKVYAKTATGDIFLGESQKLTGSRDWSILSSSYILGDTAIIGAYVELVMDGSGVSYFDSVYMSASSEPISTTLTVTPNGVNTLQYYAKDNLSNAESVKTATLKIDKINPTGWLNFDAVRQGNEHTLVCSIDVLDNESGLKAGEDIFQYSVTGGLIWGYYNDLLSCGSNFVINGFKNLNSVTTDGQNTVRLVTPPVDYCNSVWRICKSIRFYVEDVAGRSSSTDICVMGPWFKTTNGDIFAREEISQYGTATDETATYAVFGGSEITNITSTKQWIIPNYQSAITRPTYDELLAKYPNVQTVSSIPSTTGIYRITADPFRLTQSSIPNAVVTGSAYPVVFLEGDLIINSSINLNDLGGLILINRGDVDVDRWVTRVEALLYSYGKFNSGYNIRLIHLSQTLEVFGGAFANSYELPRHPLNNNYVASAGEDFIYNPLYLIKFPNFFGQRKISYNK